jgi:pimeloyl-ACP methyl ester carboxylesterase
MPFETFPRGTLYVHHFGGEGEPVVALHGLGGNHLNWMAVADGLRRWGRVLAPDLPGFGYSPAARSYSIRAHARAIAGLLESLGQPSMVLGNSMGGLVAMLIAAERPDLVARLVLVSPASPPRVNDPRIDREVTKRLVVQAVPFVGPAVVRSYVRRYSPRQQAIDTLRVVCHRPDRVPSQVLVRSLELAQTRRHQPWAIDALIRSGRSTGVRLVDRRGYARMVERIVAPTLLIAGLHDRVVPGSGVEWLASRRPDWRWETIEAGHCSQLEQPHEFIQLMSEWMEGHISAVG